VPLIVLARRYSVECHNSIFVRGLPVCVLSELSSPKIAAITCALSLSLSELKVLRSLCEFSFQLKFSFSHNICCNDQSTLVVKMRQIEMIIYVETDTVFKHIFK
jgi:hypothetical protein